MWKPKCACADPQHEVMAGGDLQKGLRKNSDEHRTSEEQLPVIEQQLAEGRRFWKLAEEFAEISDQLSRRRLLNEKAEAKATAKKGAQECL